MQAIATCEFLLSPALCDSRYVDDYYLSLTQLHSDILHSSAPPLIEDDAYHKLLNSNRFPTDKVFSQNIKENGVSVFSAQDITKIVNKILADAKSLSDLDYYWIQEWVSLILSPSLNSISEQRNEELWEFFSNLAVYSLLKKQPVYALHYDTKLLKKANVQGTLIDAYPLDTNYPVSISQDINIFPHYKKFLSEVGHEFFLDKVNCEYDLKLALYAGTLKIALAHGKPIEHIEIDSFSIGQDFIDSLIRNQSYVSGAYSGVVFDTIINILAGIPKNAISPFRESTTSAIQKISTDKSMKAFRVHITSSGLALRLMFWKKSDGKILLANIGPKNECKISE